MIALANGQEPAVLVPVVVIPVEVELAVGTVPVEVGRVAVAVDPGGAVKIYKMSSMPPPIEYSPGCILFEKIIPLTSYTKYFHFLSNASAL